MGNLTCKSCGQTDRSQFYESIGGGCCKKCFNLRQAKRFQDNKARIVAYMGGCCQLCGYARYQGALQLHHIDRTQKDPSAGYLRTWSWSRALVEIEKCVLLCANCHAEVEAGITPLSSSE